MPLCFQVGRCCGGGDDDDDDDGKDRRRTSPVTTTTIISSPFTFVFPRSRIVHRCEERAGCVIGKTCRLYILLQVVMMNNTICSVSYSSAGNVILQMGISQFITLPPSSVP